MEPEKFFPESLKLDKKDRKLIEGYIKKPDTVHFLSIVNLLERYDCAQECIEFLSWGVRRFPDYLPGRVRLCRELYHKGLIQDAWDCLNAGSPEGLSQNSLGQVLKLKLAILCGFEVTVSLVLSQLEQTGTTVPDVHELKKRIQSGGLRSAGALLLSQFKRDSVEVILPPKNEFQSGDELGQNGQQISEGRKTPYRNAARPFFSLSESFFNDPSLKGFYVVPVSEVFSCPELNQEDIDSHSPVDTPTIAEIYFKQGLYTKALGVYRNLLAMSPGHEGWLSKVREIQKLLEEQGHPDLTPDRALIHKWEEVRGMKRKTKFYNQLLERLKQLDIQT